MGIQNIGHFFKQLQKELRINRREFSKDVCSERTIYAIEQGTEGVQIDIFQGLMAKYGLRCTYLPAFRDKSEFDAFRSLTDAMYCIQCWNLSSAYPLLLLLQGSLYSNSQMIYRRAQLAKLLLLLRSGTAKASDLNDLAAHLFEGANVTIENFDDRYASFVEFQMLIAYSEAQLRLKKTEDALVLIERVIKSLEGSNLPKSEKNELLTKAGLVHAQCLFYSARYEESEQVSASAIERGNRHICHDALPELVCWNALACERLGNVDAAKEKISDLFDFLHLHFHQLSGRIYQIVKENQTGKNNLLQDRNCPAPSVFPFPKENREFAKILLDQKPAVHCDYQLGDIIRDMRIEQDMTQAELANGLCDRSQLSKIEKKILYPVRLLAEGLLERLGLRAGNFTFFATKEEYDYEELKYDYTLYNFHNEYEKLSDMENFYSRKEEKGNRLIRQTRLLNCAFAAPTLEARLKMLKEGLACTFNDSWDNIYKQKGLSYSESALFLRILQVYNSMEEYEKAYDLAMQLIAFHAQKKYELDARWRVFETVSYQYIYALFNLQYYKEIEDVVQGYSPDLPLNDISNLAYVYFFSCQALVMLKRDHASILTHAKATAAGLRLLGYTDELENFHAVMLDEYGFKL